MPRGVTIINYTFSLIGVLVGLCGCFVFYIYENNWAVFWSFISAFLSFLNLHLHSLHLKHKLEEWHTVETLAGIKEFAFIVFVLLFSIFIWYLFTVIYYDKPVYPIKDSEVVIAVWVFMSTKMAFLLYRTGDRYGKLLFLSYRLLVPF